MHEAIKTLVSEGHVSLILSTGEDYECCVLPRCDAFLFGKAVEESAKGECSINFDTDIMDVDILCLGGGFVVDCTHKESAKSFQFAFEAGLEVAERLKTAALRGKDQFGVPSSGGKWGFFRTAKEKSA